MNNRSLRIAVLFAVCLGVYCSGGNNSSGGYGSTGVPGSSGGQGSWEEIGENLYLFRDSANVYALVDDRRACLVGFASGRALASLAEIGADELDLVLITHHHREGLEGISDAVGAGAEVVIPVAEAPYIEKANHHWQTKRFYVNFEGRSRFNVVPEDVSVARKVAHLDTIEWGPYRFEVVQTPGHTDGSVSYLVPVGDKSIAFTGDFYTAPGKTLTYHDLHWDYDANVGFSAAIRSAEMLKERCPLWVLPEHGEPFMEKGPGLKQLDRRLSSLQELLRANRSGDKVRKPLDAYSPHIVFIDNPVTHAIVSDSKHAIVLDPGFCRRDKFKEFIHEYGIKSVDAVTFSHFHDDHVARAHEMLYRWQGSWDGPVKSRIWLFEEMVDVFTHPERYNLPCLFPSPIRPDRVIADGEVVSWQGLELTFHHFPGQTWYHTVILFEADGHRWALVGDSIWKPGDRSKPIKGPVIPRNRYFLDHGYNDVFQVLLDYDVDRIVPSHYDPFEVDRADLERSLKWAEKIGPAIAALTSQVHPGYALDPHWAHFYPYRIEVEQEQESTMAPQHQNPKL